MTQRIALTFAGWRLHDAAHARNLRTENMGPEWSTVDSDLSDVVTYIIFAFLSVTSATLSSASGRSSVVKAFCA